MNLNPFKNPYKTATFTLGALISSDFVKLYEGNIRSRRSGINPIDNWLNFSHYDTYIGSITAYEYKGRGIVAVAEERDFNGCGKIPFITGDDITVYEMIFVPKSDSAENEEEIFRNIIIESCGFSDNAADICKKPQFGKNTEEKNWLMAAKEIGFNYPNRQVKKKEIDANDLKTTLKMLDEFYNAVPR